jgi:hypothetical protein
MQMMTVQATRGVVVGVGDNMKAGEIRELPSETAKYLKAIGAVTDKVEAPKGSK